MALFSFQATIVNEAGDVMPDAVITVQREVAGLPPAACFADKDGLVALGGTFDAGPSNGWPDGYFRFYATGGFYRITATSGAFSRVWQDVGIGTAPIPAFRSIKTVNQTGIPDLTITRVQWDTDAFDIGGLAANSAWTPPAGIVCIQASVCVTAVGAFQGGGQNRVIIRKNGSILAQGNQLTQAGDAFVIPTGVVIDKANDADVYDVWVNFDISGGSATIVGDSSMSYFSGAWLGPAT